MSARGVLVGALVLVLAAGGAVVADRVAVSAAQDAAVRELRANVAGVTGTPEVAISGFPFLTQLLGGKLTDVTAHADGLTIDGVGVTDVNVDAVGVSTHVPYTIYRAVLTGALSAGALQQLLATKAGVDLKLSINGDQLLAATQVLGLDVTAALVPRAENGKIRLDAATVTFGKLAVDVSALPGRLGTQLKNLLVPIDGLPAGFALSGVVVRDGGVRITVTGRDVVLAPATTGPTPSP